MFGRRDGTTKELLLRLEGLVRSHSRLARKLGKAIEDRRALLRILEVVGREAGHNDLHRLTIPQLKEKFREQVKRREGL